MGQNDTQPICGKATIRRHRSEDSGGYSGLSALQEKLVVEQDDLERKAKAAAPKMEQIAAQAKARPCQPGESDPAFANRTIEKEKKTVVEFARRQPDVLKAAGTIKEVSATTYRQQSQSMLPIRYTVSVEGTSKTVYAEIDVSRSGNSSSFVLACVTHLSVGQRDPFKDVCAQ